MSTDNAVETKDIYQLEKSRYETEIETVNDTLYKTVCESNDNHSITKIKPLVMDKHDQMKDQIDDIIQHISSKNPVLLVGKSKTINRLISVVEIAKTKVPMRQYNKLIQQSSLKNPNHKASAMTNAQKQNLVEELEPKRYLLPILFIYLVPKEINCDVDWTCQ